MFQGRRKNRAGWATCVLACEREDPKKKKRFEIDQRFKFVTNLLMVQVQKFKLLITERHKKKEKKIRTVTVSRFREQGIERCETD